MFWPHRFTTLIISQCGARRLHRFGVRNCAQRRDSNRRTAFSALALVGAIAWLTFTAGCGKPARVKVAPVSGKVTYRGQGVPHATVIFFPGDDVAEKAKKMRPFASTDAQGKFALETYADGDGAPLGTYRVSIVAVSNIPAAKSNKDRRPGDESTPAATALAIPPEVTKKYGSVDSSGIQVTVHDGENNLDPFAL